MCRTFTILLTLICASFLFMPDNGWTIARVILDERFDRDPEQHSFPWLTQANPWVMRWRFNARNWPGGEGNGSVTWGWQDVTYSERQHPNARFHGALWCALADSLGPDSTRDVEEDNYIDNQNAWVWWGPFNTEGWVEGSVQFWLMMDLANFAGDSLTVGVVPERDSILTLDGDEFRESFAVGTTVKRGTQGAWQSRSFRLDSLMLEGERVDYLDREDSLFLAFVWQSNERAVAGQGAFIDDVIMMYDDGLFELTPLGISFGHPVGEDSVDWVDEAPLAGEDVYFRLDWEVEGSDETPEFLVQCFVDDEMILEEEYAVDPREQRRFSTITDRLWRVEEGEHILRWVLDPPLDEGGSVEEANEENNSIEAGFPNVRPVEPQFRILTPGEDSVEVFDAFDVEFSLSDSTGEAADTTLRVWLFWTFDTTGMSENPDTVFTWHEIWRSNRESLGERSVEFDVEREIRGGRLPEGSLIHIAGTTGFGYPGYPVTAAAPGRLWIHEPDEIGGSPRELPRRFGITKAFPNPFNDGLTVEFILPRTVAATVSVQGMDGRTVDVLIQERKTSGSHTAVWHPRDAAAGVYWIVLHAGENASLKQAVYLP